MKTLRVIAALVLTPLVLFAEDAAAEYAKRAKKLEQEEGLGRAALAKHCETTKMWKDAVAEWSRVAEIFPDNKEAADHLAKAQQRADVVESRPGAAEAQQYKDGLAALRKSLGKKWRDLSAWAKSKGLEDQADEAVALADDFESVKKESSDPKQQAVDLLNRFRKKCHLKPVTLSPALSEGAQKHTDYLAKNEGHPSTEGLGGHNEDPSLPGYTPEGAKAGMQSDIGHAPPPQSMAGMLGSFYHRIPLLLPDLKEVGIGYTPSTRDSGRGGGYCAIDYSGVGEKDEKSPRIVAFPADGQKNVQRAFDSEQPDPIPAGRDREAGMAITLTFADKPAVTDVSVEVRAAGVEISGYVSSPDKPARADVPGNEDTITFIPETPLAANTVYKVKVTATVDGQPFTKEWEFTTGAKMAEGRGW